MKLNKLLVLGSVFALAACGAAKPVVLDETQAIERAEQIAASQETIDANEYNVQLVLYTEMGGESESMTTNIVFDCEEQYFYLGQGYTVGEEDMGSLGQWVYVQDDTLYVVTSTEEGTNEILASFKTSDLGDLGLSINDFEGVVNFLCGVDDLLGDIGVDLYGSMLLGAEAISNLFASTTPEMMEILGFTSLEFTASSKGPGHLILDTAATADFSEEGYTSTMSIHEAIVWENNLVVDYVNDMTLVEGEDTSVFNEHYSVSYKVTPEYPVVG